MNYWTGTNAVKLSGEGESSKRVLVDVSSSSMFSSWMEQGDSKREFLESLEALRREGLINYSWERFEKGNLVDKVWLVTDEAAVEKSYLTAGRIPRQRKLAVLDRQICVALHETGLDKDELKNGDLTKFLLEEVDEIREKKRIPRFFFDGTDSFREDERRNRDLLIFLKGDLFL